jgi:16S rRNA (cytosine1402-N4)-methyltransferase
VEAGERHAPVLMEETFDLLRLRPGDTYLDLTAGLGGHAARAAQEVGPDGLVVLIDRDAESLRQAAEKVAREGAPVRAAHGNYADLCAHLDALGIDRVDVVLADLGLCAVQLDTGRGMSFRDETSLDMRMDRSTGVTAEEYLNDVDEAELARVLREYGDQPGAGRVARAVVAARRREPIRTAAQFAAIVAGSAPRPAGRSRTHPATQAMMSLRMVVNAELPSLERMLPAALARLRVGGRMAFIAFHSGEARLVKTFIDRMRGKCQCEPGALDCRCGRERVVESLTPRAVKPSAAEVSRSPLSRSAVLRAAAKTAPWPA